VSEGVASEAVDMMEQRQESTVMDVAVQQLLAAPERPQREIFVDVDTSNIFTCK
jgi:hypothetical protein